MRIPDHFVRVIPLPAAVRGVTVPNDDGTFSVYINALYDTETQRATLEHELEHLARDHFYTSAPVAVQEAEASGRTPVASAPAPGTIAPAAVPVRRTIRLYKSPAALEAYLRSIDALSTPVDTLGRLL